MKIRILTFLHLGCGWGKSNTVTTRHVTASQNWVEKQLLATAAFWSKESVKGVIQNFWQKKKGHIFFISKIFHITSTLCLVKPSLWTSASPYFDSVCSRQCRRHLDTHSLLILIIMFNRKKWWLNSGGFQPCFGVFSRCERRYPCNSGTSQKISWEQLVTCNVFGSL